jgi:hypothetical protein
MTVWRSLILAWIWLEMMLFIWFCFVGATLRNPKSQLVVWVPIVALFHVIICVTNTLAWICFPETVQRHENRQISAILSENTIWWRARSRRRNTWPCAKRWHMQVVQVNIYRSLNGCYLFLDSRWDISNAISCLDMIFQRCSTFKKYFFNTLFPGRPRRADPHGAYTHTTGARPGAGTALTVCGMCLFNTM